MEGLVKESVLVPAGDVHLAADLTIPAGAEAIVAFAHGTGSSRMSPRNQFVASVLNDGQFATLLMDLITAEEEKADDRSGEYRFNIDLISRRLVHATDWLIKDKRTAGLRIGYFGASTGAAAAIVGAAHRPDQVCAVVSRGGRADLAGDALHSLIAPTVLIVGSNDRQVVALNEQAMAEMHKAKARHLEIVEGASHLFEEPGALAQVAELARQWFDLYMLEPNL